MEQAPLYTDIAECPEGGRAFFVKAKDGARIRFALWNGGGRGLALVFPGRTECVEKYGRMAAALIDRGFSVVVIDWRGQGLSDRLNNSTAVGHVDSFQSYQQDLDAVLTNPEVASISGPRVMFAHSMGGCIGLRAAQERQDIDYAVFSAPMWGLNLLGANKLIAPLLAIIGTTLGLGSKSIPGQPKGFYLTRDPFMGNNLTNDRDYWDYMKNQIVAQPALALGPPSFCWLRNALGEFKHFDNSQMPSTPTLAFVGSEESIVSPAAVHQQINRFANAKVVEISGGRHEVWMETPERQAQCWAEIDTFLSTHIPA